MWFVSVTFLISPFKIRTLAIRMKGYENAEMNQSIVSIFFLALIDGIEMIGAVA